LEEKVILDLGCGGKLHGNAVGIDNVGPPNSLATYVCNLGFDSIPLPDNSCEAVLSNHFIEHIPFEVWYQNGVWKENSGPVWKRYLPLVQLLNEVYRVLRNRGLFKIIVPIVTSGYDGYVNMQMFQDLSHVSFWTPETSNYISGDYYSFHGVYGHTSRFEKFNLSFRGTRNWMMELDLLAVKDVPEDTPFTYLDYDELLKDNAALCKECGLHAVYWNKSNRCVQCHNCGWVEFHLPQIDLS
jgi:hypothetical protein